MNIPVQRLEIAAMSKETVGAVAEIEKECFASPWSLDSLASELSNPLAVFRTVQIDGKVVGYAGMHHVVDEGYITNIAVLPDYRRLGAARALMDALLEYGRKNGLSMITLEVRESNAAARKLYRELDFADVGRRVNFYSRPAEDAVLMTREL